jgi:Type II intron maturase
MPHCLRWGGMASLLGGLGDRFPQHNRYLPSKSPAACGGDVYSPVYTRVGAATRRTVKERLQLRVPQTKMSEFCQRKGYGNYAHCHPSARPGWAQMDDAEILLAYNAEMRGLANYYALANAAKTGLTKLMYLAQSSFLATLAWKHKSSMSKEYSRLREHNALRAD